MIVLIKPLNKYNTTFQGIAVDAPDHLPTSIWHGSIEKVKEGFIREYRTADIQFINLHDGWDKVYE